MQQFMSKGHGTKRKVHPLTPKKVMPSTEKNKVVKPDLDATQIIPNKTREGVDSNREGEVEDTEKTNVED